MKLRTSLLALLVCSTAQANLFERKDFVLEDRVIPLPKEGYIHTRERIKAEEETLSSIISDAKTLEAKTKIICEIVDDKFERLALASANLKYPEARHDYSLLKQELEYDIKMLGIGSMSCNI